MNQDALLMVGVMLIVAVGGLTAVAIVTVVRLCADRGALTGTILKLADRVLVAQDEQMARMEQESKERVALHHIDMNSNGAVPREPEPRPRKSDRTITAGTDDGD